LLSSIDQVGIVVIDRSRLTTSTAANSSFCHILHWIKWECWCKNDIGALCLVTVDGTDFKINEPTPFSRKWHTQKLKHAGLWCEVGICIQTGWIVWINGPYAPGDWPDLAISRDGLNEALAADELFLADGTHRDGNGWSFAPTGVNRLVSTIRISA